MYLSARRTMPTMTNFTLVWYHVLFTSGGFGKVTLFRGANHYISLCKAHGMDKFNPFLYICQWFFEFYPNNSVIY
jgi:hypothetical protein